MTVIAQRDTRRVVVVSRHRLTRRQKQALAEGGYLAVRYVNPPGRCFDSLDAWVHVDIALKGHIPDVLIVILPASMFGEFVRRAARFEVPVIVPTLGDNGRWSGVWLRASVHGETLTWAVWTPEEEVYR